MVRPVCVDAGLDLRFARAEKYRNCQPRNLPTILEGGRVVGDGQLSTDFCADGKFLDERQKTGLGRPDRTGRRVVRSGAWPGEARRVAAISAFSVCQCEPQLPKVVLAAHPSRGLAGRLDSRQQQADERPNNGNHNEQLNERETGACSALQAKLWHVSTRWIFGGTMGRLMKVRLSLNNNTL